MTIVSAILALLVLAAVVPLSAAELKQEAVLAYDHYVQLATDRFEREVHNPNAFLWADSLPQPERERAHARLRAGEVIVERVDARENGQEIKAPGALIHHWRGTVFVPGATLRDTLALMQDYDHVENPDVKRSKLLAQDGNDFKIYLRLYKKRVITVEMNTEHDARYSALDANHVYSRSHATRIAEVEKPGPHEREKPSGNDGGFLWRLESYWRLEQKDGGVYIECQTVSLTRNAPTGLGWIMAPFVTSVPKESVATMLAQTRLGVQKRMEPLVSGVSPNPNTKPAGQD